MTQPDQQDSASKAHTEGNRYCSYCDRYVEPAKYLDCPDCGNTTRSAS